MCENDFVVERLENDLDSFLEYFAVGVLVEHRAAEAFDFASVIAASDTEHGAPAGQDVGGREILGKPQWVPHRGDVKAAADFELLGHVRQMDRHHQDVWQALVAFVLEMMLGEPQGLVAEAVHAFRDRLGLFIDAGEMLVGIAPLIRRSGVLPAVGKIDMAGINGGKFCDHHRPSGSAFQSSRDAVSRTVTQPSHIFGCRAMRAPAFTGTSRIAILWRWVSCLH